MATKFLDTGGDATFNVAATAGGGGFWDSVVGSVIATDFVHGNHLKSTQYRANNADTVRVPSGTISDAGARISYYVYIVALPTATNPILSILNGSASVVLKVKLTSGGVLQLWNATVQIGTNGGTLSTGTWYRISLAFTVTTSTINRFELFVDGVSSISVTNATLSNTGSAFVYFGKRDTDLTLDFRSSDHYIDDSSALTDPGNIWVTAKRPNANGTTNGFTTQIGAGGSGYGTGHSPQVNERALSTTNGWSMVGSGSAVTEEYNIESASTGDINITGATIVDYAGWAYMTALAGETTNMIVNGVNFSQAITTANVMYTKFAGSTTYPAGSGADIGIQTDTSLTTVKLFECGVMVAYIPAVASSFVPRLPLLGVG